MTNDKMLTYDVEGHNICIPEYVSDLYEHYVGPKLSDEMNRFTLIGTQGEDFDKVPYNDNDLSLRTLYAILTEVFMYARL